MLLHTIDHLFRPLKAEDSTYRDTTVSLKKRQSHFIHHDAAVETTIDINTTVPTTKAPVASPSPGNEGQRVKIAPLLITNAPKTKIHHVASGQAHAQPMTLA
jgi:hypothetical protein